VPALVEDLGAQKRRIVHRVDHPLVHVGPFDGLLDGLVERLVVGAHQADGPDQKQSRQKNPHPHGYSFDQRR
jgi:hypothetical protein